MNHIFDPRFRNMGFCAEWLSGFMVCQNVAGIRSIDRSLRLPADCSIHLRAFEGFGTVCVFAPKGGTKEQYCMEDTNPCIFMEMSE